MTTEQKPAIDQAMAELEVQLSEMQREELTVLEADAALAQSRGEDDLSWLPEWYLGQLRQLEAVEAAIKDHTKVLLKQVEGRRAALKWRWGREVNAQVDSDLRAQGGKKRSKTYATGKAGYRAVSGGKSVVVDDEDKAIAHAADACPKAVKVTRSLLKNEMLSHIEATGEVLRGTHVEEKAREDRFFMGKQVFIQPALPVQPTQSKQTAKQFFATTPEGASK